MLEKVLTVWAYVAMAVVCTVLVAVFVGAILVSFVPAFGPQLGVSTTPRPVPTAATGPTSTPLAMPGRLGDPTPVVQPAADWQSLGPTGPGYVGRLGVSPDWPADRFTIVSLFYPQVGSGPARSGPPGARSFDGGRTWQPLTEAPGEGLLVTRTDRSGRVLFAQSSERKYGGASIVRSIDDGLSWTPVLRLQGERFRTPIVLSPAYRSDERLVVLDAGLAWQSFDAGTAWARLDPVPGQRIESVIFSPEFAHDRTMYLTATTAPRMDPIRTNPGDSDHPVTSAGVLVSVDAGQNWTSVSAGLQIDGQPYRAVQNLAISPTFSRDGTLFAFAAGAWVIPSERSSGVSGPHYALFRSQDRGHTWTAVWEPYSRTQAFDRGVSGRILFTIALSPTFADDGAIRAQVVRTYGTPRPPCMSLRSSNGGATWASSAPPGGPSGTCPAPRWLATADPHIAAWWLLGGPLGQVAVPPTEIGSSAAPPMRPNSYVVSSIPVLVSDGTIFYPAQGGVWASGPSVVRTEARLPCTIGERGAFAVALAAASLQRPFLGCPLDEPRPVTVRERLVNRQGAEATERLLWLGDTDLSWLRLWHRQGGTPGYPEGPVATWMDASPNLTEATRPDAADRTVEGEVQHFQGGLILRLPGANVVRSVLVVSQTSWTEIPDP